MTTIYSPLPQAKLNKNASIIYPKAGAVAEITLDSPARAVLTDFQRVEPVTIAPATLAAAANRKMIEHGIRLLLVTDQGDHVFGIITATDILGEKPLQHSQKVGGSIDEIQVQDIMTPFESLEVLSLGDVEWATVGQVIETLKRDGRQHALVVDDGQEAQQRIVGIFSATQISRLMNVRVEVPEVAQSFAEIEAALAH